MLLNKAKQGFKWLFFVKIFSRIIDFILNILVIRHIDSTSYGLTTNMQLLLNFTLFYLKVCLKQTYTRNKNVDDLEQKQSAINLMFIGWLTTIIFSPFIFLLLTYNQDETYQKGALLFTIAALIEGLAEVFAVHYVLSFQYKIIAQAETIGVFIKTLILWVGIVNLEIEVLTAFGIAQIIYSLLYFLILFQKIRINKINGQYVQPEMKQLGIQFTLNGLMRFPLQELEKIVMVLYDNKAVSGEFTLVSNIGSILPRFIYAPLEEVSYNLFSKLNKTEQTEHLSRLLQLLNLIGLSVVCAGVQCSQVFLKIYGEQWTTSSCVRALQVYCLYEWLMGVNGVTESFVNATIPIKQMRFYRYCLIGQTVIYCICLATIVNLGASGIVLSNCISMSLRIALSFSIIKQNMFNTLPKYTYLYLFGLVLQFYFNGWQLFIIVAFYYGCLLLLNLYHLRHLIKQYI